MINRVLIWGYYGKRNLGDEAILRTVIENLKQINPNIDITVASDDLKYTYKLHNVLAVKRKNLFDLICQIKKSDALIIGGGGQTYKKWNFILYMLLLVSLCKVLNKKIIAYAIGVEDIKGRLKMMMCAYMFNNIDDIIVRDHFSYNMLKKIGVKKEVKVTADPVFAYKKTDTHTFKNGFIQKIKGFRKEDKILIGLSLVATNNIKYSQIRQYYPLIVKTLLNYECQVILVPMSVNEGDLKVINETLRKIESNKSLNEDILVIDNVLDPDQILEIVSEVDAVIGMRLHFLIFGAIKGKPLAAIVRSPKVLSIINLLEQIVLSDISSVNIRSLEEKLEMFLTKRDELKKRCIENVNELKIAASSNIIYLKSFITH